MTDAPVIDDEFFKTRIAVSSKPVLIFVHAVWCAPSLAFRDTVYDAMEILPPEVMLAEIDIEKAPQSCQALRVKGTPWLAVVKEGQPLGSYVGTMTIDSIVEFVDRCLNPPAPKAKRSKKAA
ncbi:thioredoxin-2 [Sphingobium phage Lacusarx]|uniref:Thioredoxin-2 n=1 Tax=Sphingobium phage Lacusarx TaxID=1980139 RepID=A0A1W6DX86_9CAUD|nr:thioredoxin-2 [Sphingobium phage Lacusarx]ARK07533.1 thioredoxin-2 [Sphingobium phage Lacusarx]